MPDLERLERIALALADAARPIARRHFRRPLDVETKADMSPVTAADREVEAAMRRVLATMAPDDGIFGEEEGASRLDAETVWVIDPIDGTRTFVAGLPLFGTLVAAAQGGVPVLGVVEMPAIEERYVGAQGRGATLDGRPLRTSGQERIDDTVLCLAPHPPMDAATKDGFARLVGRGRIVLGGHDCYAYARLAAGSIDAVVETGLKPYDYMALVPVIEAAGGCITDWQGRPLGFESDGRVAAAANPPLHAALLGLLSG